MTLEIDARANLSAPPFSGMKKVKDISSLHANQFEHLENVRLTVAGTFCPRDGLAIMGVADAEIDGIFDAGDAGWKVEAAPPTSIVGGGVPTTPPAFSVAPLLAGTGGTRIDFNAALAQGFYYFHPTNLTDLLSYIKDANDATIITPELSLGRNSAAQNFSIAAPAIADDLLVTEVMIHVRPTVTMSAAHLYGRAGLGGIAIAEVQAGVTGYTLHTDVAVPVSRPGGGQWYGRDLKDATFYIGFRVDWDDQVDPTPEFSEVWMTYRS